MNDATSHYRIRVGAAALAFAGVMFAFYPATSADSGENSLRGAQAYASTAWIVAHAMGTLAFIGLAIGLIGLHLLTAPTSVKASRESFWAVVSTWAGASLTLTYYGAEAFGNGPGLVIFGAGPVLLAVGGVLAALAVWRVGGLAGLGGVLLAAGLVLYIPQFYGPPAVHVAHGLVLAAGCLWLAIGMWGHRRRQRPAGAAAEEAPMIVAARRPAAARG